MGKFIKIILSLIFCTTLQFLHKENLSLAQTTQEWQQTFNGPENYIDYSCDIALDVFGNVYSAGHSNNFFTIIKYNPSGQQEWLVREIIGYSRAKCIRTDDLGNVYVTGFGNNNGSSASDIITIKYTPSGEKLWEKRCFAENSLGNFPNSMYIDKSRNIYITGYTVDNIDRDYITVKYNSNGDEQWMRLTGSTSNPGFDRANSVVVSESGNVYLTGASYETISNTLAMTTVKFDTEGNLIWLKNFNEPLSPAEGYFITVNSNEEIFVCGFIQHQNPYRRIFTTLKYNSSGNLLWSRYYNNPNSNTSEAKALTADNSGNVYVTGYFEVPPISANLVTIKYNSSGDQSWIEEFQSTQANPYSLPTDIQIDPDNNIYVTAYDNFNWGIQILKYNSAGQRLWSVYNKQGKVTGGIKFILDHQRNIYLTARIFVDGQNYNFITMKYSQDVGISENNSSPGEFELSQNYPNPFNPSTVINYELRITSFVFLKVYDENGKEVATLINENKPPGNYSVQFDGSNFASGVYYYKLEAGDFSEVKKMILLK